MKGCKCLLIINRLKMKYFWAKICTYVIGHLLRMSRMGVTLFPCNVTTDISCQRDDKKKKY
jgi:hypothetical protein